MSWQEVVTDISANIFTDLTRINVLNDKSTYEPCPSMPLQIFLFFNVYFFPFWFVTTIIFLYIKYEELGNLTQFLIIVVMVMTTIIECMRLYLGYLGNLSEQIPELAGFWMLSILLQLPMQSFILLNPFLQPRPVELTINCVLWGLLVAELLTGFYALRNAAARAKLYYSLRSHLKALSISETNKNSSENKGE